MRREPLSPPSNAANRGGQTAKIETAVAGLTQAQAFDGSAGALPQQFLRTLLLPVATRHCASLSDTLVTRRQVHSVTQQVVRHHSRLSHGTYSLAGGSSSLQGLRQPFHLDASAASMQHGLQPQQHQPRQPASFTLGGAAHSQHTGSGTAASHAQLGGDHFSPHQAPADHAPLYDVASAQRQ